VSSRSEQDPRTGSSLEEFQRDLADNLCYERGTTVESASGQDAYWTLAVTVRGRLADRRARTARANYLANPKFIYYLSAEYMLGRQLRQNALYTGTADVVGPAVAASGFSASELEALDVEPGLGNGGLGRLAACLLDSMASLDLPAVGYGIRYEFGIFKQAFEDGHQVEHPDDWTFYGNPWEFPAPDDRQVVGFYGHTEAVDDDQGGLRARWVPGETVRGEPSHMLVPGYGTETVNIIRLWRARSGPESFDLSLFNAGRYAEDNFFLFGVTAARAVAIRQGGYSPRACYRDDAELRAAIDALASGVFSGGDRGPSEQVISSILDWDEYLVLADYRSYIDCQDRAVGPAWADEDRWTRMSILNTARSGYFSSDRTVRGYCRDIWHLESVPVPADTPESRDVLP
jgi:glucan phosphorylase